MLRRFRLIAAACAVAVAWFAAPHLRLVAVPAYPTSFYTSLTDFDAFGIARGARLFARHCAACHGAEGDGDGEQARGLEIPPADLTASHLWQHSDGDMFWFLSHGIEAPRGGLSMPGFADALGADARWALIDFLRAQNAGMTMRRTGAWTVPVPAPALDAQCGDGRVISLESLRGRIVRIVVGSTAAEHPGISTIFLSAAVARPADCVAGQPELRQAYAIVAGMRADELPGTIFIVDHAGWLRARIRPTDPVPDLTALSDQLVAQPVSALPGIGHRH